jgi:hypothetical protein
MPVNPGIYSKALLMPPRHKALGLDHNRPYDLFIFNCNHILATLFWRGQQITFRRGQTDMLYFREHDGA